MTDTFIRSDFAIETEAKTSGASGKECFFSEGTSRGEAPRVTGLEGRVTSKSEIQQYLDQKRKERHAAYQRKYMRKYRKKNKRADRRKASAKRHPTLSEAEVQAVLEAARYA